MEQKRFVFFLVTSMAVLIGWQTFVIPLFIPPKKPPVVVEEEAPKANPLDNDGEVAGEEIVVEEKETPEEPADTEPPQVAETVNSEAEKPEAEKSDEQPKMLEQAERVDDLHLGSLDPTSGYRMLVTLDSRGAVVSKIELNDPRYREEHDPKAPLTIIRKTASPSKSLQISVPGLDQELKSFGTDEKGDPYSLNNVNWEIVPDSRTESGVTFRFESPDGEFAVLKRFELGVRANAKASGESAAYDLQVDLTFENRGETPRTITYELLGPVGLPLENADYARKFRDVAAGFLVENGSSAPKIRTATLTSANIAKDKTEVWTSAVRYIGVDTQYFAALLLPQGDQFEKPYLSSMNAVLVGPNLGERSDVSILLESTEIALPAAKNGKPGVESHEYVLFAGPKRVELLTPIGADRIIDYGISGNLYIPQMMLTMLGSFASLFPSWAWPYGWAIIMLTVVVRMGMFPLSRKQALSAAKMQEIQPEIAALKKKYGNDTEKMGRAQMELFRKHKYNPFGGCLLMFVQLPIFIGLYQSLNLSVDLRMAKFLWIDNLAAPDALMAFGMNVPFLGPMFNLLPIITIGLFIFQQKMFMPPPTDKDQELQQKMMSYMMIFMGFMFYSVPAGLCVYFIASSVWGLAERMILPKAKKAPVSEDGEAVAESPPQNRPAGPRKPEPPPQQSKLQAWIAKMLPEDSPSSKPIKRNKTKRR